MRHDTVRRMKIRRLPVTFRAEPELGEGVVVGYVTKYDVEYQIGFSTRERIASGAFDESLAGQTSLPIFWEHDWAAGPIGITTNAGGDDDGVRVEAQLFLDDPRGRSVWRAMEAGALREWSVGYYPQEIVIDEEDPGLETITRGDLAEASVVVRGANPDTETVEVRKHREDDEEIIDDPELRDENDDIRELDPERDILDAAWRLLEYPEIRASVAEDFDLDRRS